MLTDANPAEAFIHRLGQLNCTLENLIRYMEAVGFWAGLENFYEPCKNLVSPSNKTGLLATTLVS